MQPTRLSPQLLVRRAYDLARNRRRSRLLFFAEFLETRIALGYSFFVQQANAAFKKATRAAAFWRVGWDFPAALRAMSEVR